jgi:hypothetical protein
MPSQPYEDATADCDAADEIPTQQERKELIQDTLHLARLFGPGPEQSQLQQIARSLTFLIEDGLQSDETAADETALSLCGGPSTTSDVHRVVGIRLPRALLESIRRWADAKGLPLSDGIKIWLQMAVVKQEQIRTH